MNAKWGRWTAHNATRRVTAYGSFPGFPDKEHNNFWVRFDPPTESSIPDAILAHMLGKADEALMDGGDQMDIRLPSKIGIGKCWERQTIRVRINDGSIALESH